MKSPDNFLGGVLFAEVDADGAAVGNRSDKGRDIFVVFVFLFFNADVQEVFYLRTVTSDRFNIIKLDTCLKNAVKQSVFFGKRLYFAEICGAFSVNVCFELLISGKLLKSFFERNFAALRRIM